MSVHGAFCCRPAIAASVAASSSVMVSPGKETIVPELPSSSPENFSNGCDNGMSLIVSLPSGCRLLHDLRARACMSSGCCLAAVQFRVYDKIPFCYINHCSA